MVTGFGLNNTDSLLFFLFVWSVHSVSTTVQCYVQSWHVHLEKCGLTLQVVFLSAVKPPTLFYFILICNVKSCTTELSALSSVLMQN